jgi:hypothetical protein
MPGNGALSFACHEGDRIERADDVTVTTWTDHLRDETRLIGRIEQRPLSMCAGLGLLRGRGIWLSLVLAMAVSEVSLHPMGRRFDAPVSGPGSRMGQAAYHAALGSGVLAIGHRQRG